MFGLNATTKRIEKSDNVSSGLTSASRHTHTSLSCQLKPSPVELFLKGLWPAHHRGTRCKETDRRKGYPNWDRGLFLQLLSDRRLPLKCDAHTSEFQQAVVLTEAEMRPVVSILGKTCYRRAKIHTIVTCVRACMWMLTYPVCSRTWKTCVSSNRGMPVSVSFCLVISSSICFILASWFCPHAFTT